ncbi:hypothetical protein FEM48_Zijuj11G0111700 [Ziziphus jujuba var. spinosa]|uniref:Uncharacterized protein n=1 Tax=Ziziphus jujuba var. spinosa TaxID=714518 RepID=A0A978UIL7_ZIZJJ|nr:hypothetical protein FEM48_Zijuj11G0111700 [Ziziphus jujuba var. spinosa]
MAGGNFMHRVVSYLMNEVLVNSLANRYTLPLFHVPCSLLVYIFFRAFQRFAVRTSKRIEDISSIAEKKKQQLSEQMKDLAKNFESRNQ